MAFRTTAASFVEVVAEPPLSGSPGGTTARSLPAGYVLKPGELAPALAERWEAGDSHLRGLLEHVEIPGMPPHVE